jgi:hypothetical protein
VSGVAAAREKPEDLGSNDEPGARGAILNLTGLDTLSLSSFFPILIVPLLFGCEDRVATRQKICGNGDFTSQVFSDAMTTMGMMLIPEDSFSSRLHHSFRRASELHMLSLQLLIDRFQLRAKLGRNWLEANELLIPLPYTPGEELLWPEFGPYYWLPYVETTVTPATWTLLAAPEPNEWRRWQWLAELRSARRKEIFAVVRQSVRLLTQFLLLSIKALGRPLFACHLSRKEHVWMLLHGAHPAREDAEISQPAFAQLWEGTLRIRPA